MPPTPQEAVLLPIWSLGFYLMWRIPSFARCSKVREVALAGDRPRVSVIIPARNESERIGPLLQSLREQTLAPLEVIVVDDHSSDGTAAVAQRLNAHVIEGLVLPEGWTGKTWACWQGAQRAAGDLLVFLDADVRLEPSGLACILETYQDRGGLLTVQPYHFTQKPYEQLSAFFNLVLMAGLNTFTLHGQAIRPAGAFGPCAVCDKQEYLRLGGHGHPEVRGHVLESIPLARLFLEHGLPVRCYGGRGAVSFRMYPGGFGQLLEGWTKGFGTGALAVRLPFLILTVAWISGCFGAFVTLANALLQPLTLATLYHILVYGLYALQIWWILRRIGRFQWWASALFPLPLCFFALVMLRSFVTIRLLGRVQWRGRTVATNHRQAER